jgi:hypothetical protein
MRNLAGFIGQIQNLRGLQVGDLGGVDVLVVEDPVDWDQVGFEFGFGFRQKSLCFGN